MVVPEYRLSAAKSVKTSDGWETSVHVENVGTGRMPVEVAVLAGERVLDPTDRVVTDPDVRVLQLRRAAAVVKL